MNAQAGSQSRIPGSWVLLDAASSTELKSRNANAVQNPGELVNAMTLLTALEIMREKKISLDDYARLSPLDAKSLLSQRRIFLEPDKPASFSTLLKAIAIVGAEDAALAVATTLAGSSHTFVSRMNAIASELHLKSSVFTSPTASDDQQSTSFDMALIMRELMVKYPQAFAWFSEKEFEFAGHRQRNHNSLLWRNSEISGGILDTSGMKIIGALTRSASSGRPPRQLVVTIMGELDSEQTMSSAMNLLRSGKLDFETLHLFKKNHTITKVKVIKGNRDSLEVGSPHDIWVTLPRKIILSRGIGGFTTKLEYKTPVIAPIQIGEHIGTLKIFFEGKPVSEHPMVALHEVGKGSFFSRFIDSVQMKTSQSPNQHIFKGTQNDSGK